MPTSPNARFPRLASFLADLPRGLDSFPECQAKGAMVRTMVQGRLDDVPPDALPSEIRALILSPPMNSQWVPDTHFFGALLALGDHRGLGQRAFHDWLLELNRALFKSPVYKLLSLGSPSLLLTLGSATWGSTHRGTRLSVEAAPGGAGGKAVLTFPDRLYGHPDVLAAIRAGLQTAIELSNAKNPRLTVGTTTATSAEFIARWD